MLRYTENLGFDAVYYQYNALNQVTAVVVADPLRQYDTWYGYDYNGRVDSVWTRLTDYNYFQSGLGMGLAAAPAVPERDEVVTGADITYHYTKQGLIDTTWYPPIRYRTSSDYTKRGGLSGIDAMQQDTLPPFDYLQEYSLALGYDSAGRISSQDMIEHPRLLGGPGSQLHQQYRYDHAGRLARWINTAGDTVAYSYDAVGNRLADSIGVINGSLVLNHSYGYGGTGPNHLTVAGSYNYEYDPDGALIRKIYTGQPQEDRFGYSYRNLLRQYAEWSPQLHPEVYLDWRYRYSPAGQRQQKRLYTWNGTDTLQHARAWVYYLLGGSGEQLSVWHGVESTDTLPCGLTIPNTVYMYPVEYLSYGQETAYTKEDLARVITRPDAIDTTGIKEFRFADHDGSLRFSVDESGQVRTYDYDPWGAVIASSAGDTARKGFNDAEEDRENSTFDLGARHYDESLGRFLSVDPLMAKSPSVSPYVYSGDDPVNFTDPSGMQRGAIVSPERKWETMPLESGGDSHGQVGRNTRIVNHHIESLSEQLQNLSPGEQPDRAQQIKEEVEALKRMNGGSNRVTIRTEKFEMDVDLAGRSHYGGSEVGQIETPHVHIKPRNFQAPEGLGRVYDKGREIVREANSEDLRIVRYYLESISR